MSYPIDNNFLHPLSLRTELLQRAPARFMRWARIVKAGLIQILIPIGLWHVMERSEREVKQIAGER